MSALALFPFFVFFLHLSLWLLTFSSLQATPNKHCVRSKVWQKTRREPPKICFFSSCHFQACFVIAHSLDRLMISIIFYSWKIVGSWWSLSERDSCESAIHSICNKCWTRVSMYKFIYMKEIISGFPSLICLRFFDYDINQVPGH